MGESNVSIDPQGVSNGISQFQATADGLQTTWDAAVAKINAMNGAAPWGTDDAGSGFVKQWTTDKGDQYAAGGAATVTDLTELAGLVQKAVQASLASDEQQAAEVAKAIADL